MKRIHNGQKVGTFGDIATLSFYPAHHLTMGEGGAVFTNNANLKTKVNIDEETQKNDFDQEIFEQYNHLPCSLLLLYFRLN